MSNSICLIHLYCKCNWLNITCLNIYETKLVKTHAHVYELTHMYMNNHRKSGFSLMDSSL